MFLRTIFVAILFLSANANAQLGDKKGAKMDDVVPEELIPASPVLSVEEALRSFQLAPGFVIEAVVTEPLVDKPVCLDFDASGRMWVCEMRGYMPDIDGKGEAVPEGRIVVLEDTNADGKVDQRHVFMDRLLLPRALVVFEDGLLFMDEHRLCWVRRNGVKAVGEAVVVDGDLLQIGNVEHKPNGLLPNLDNRYYLAKSDRRLRREGEHWKLEATSFRGQWGIARDNYGRLYHNNNSTLLFGDLLVPNLLQGNSGVRMKYRDFVQLGSNQLWPARVTPAVNRAYMAKRHGFTSDTLDPKTYKLTSATSAAGVTVYRGTNFPKSWCGVAFSTEPVSNLVKAISIREKDGNLEGTHVMGEREFLASTDERFRPVNVYNAPDGSLYVVDMYHGIIQHRTYMTTYLRRQTLARGLEQPGLGHGRIYRIRSRVGKLERPQDLSQLQGLDLVRVLMHENAWQREMAQRLLVERKDETTVPFLAKLAEAGSSVARIHAFWTLEGMGALKAEHLLVALRSDDAKLQASGLWASTRLGASELSKLEPVLLAMRPAGDEVLPYLARALGPLGTPKAFAKLGKLLEDHRKIPFLREALVSGLDHHEREFINTQLLGSSDHNIIGWLEEGSRGSNGIGEVLNDLSGDDLASFERGKSMFHGEAACFGCHGADGGGAPNLGPPLDESEWVVGKPEVLVRILLHGMTGPLSVAGTRYAPTADMPGLAANPTMSDQHLADIATYIRHEWCNRAAPISANFIHQERVTHQAREGRAWTAEELMK